MSTRCSQKNKERLQKEALARYQNLSKKKNKKCQYTLKNVKIFLKKKKKKYIRIIMNAIKIFLKMKNKGYQNVK